MLDEYKTIKYKSESIYKDRSSKFIGIILPVENIEVVKTLTRNKKNTTTLHITAMHIYLESIKRYNLIVMRESQ